jgi:hypothetical protein
MTLELREFQPDLQVREADNGEWTVEGIAVPYGEVINHGGEREAFAPGAFSEYRSGATLYGQHGHLRGEFPIGLVTKAEDRPEGLWVRSKISKTVAGTEAYTLLRDGVLKSMSVGFRPEAHEVRSDDTGDYTLYTRAHFGEVSIVGMPAYSGAAVTAVREQDPITPGSESDNPKGADMADTTIEITEVRSELADLTRAFEAYKAGSASGDETPKMMQYRSLAEFVKGLADGSSRKDAAGMYDLQTRDFAVVADNAGSRPGWIDRDIKLVAQNRNILEIFSKEALPATGMTVTYPVFGVVAGDVAVQATEGANLTYIEVSTSTGTSNVLTYGAYSSLSRQVIERSDSAFLAKTLQAQKLSYAKVTNGAVRTLLSNTPTAYNQAGTVAFANRKTAQPYIDAALLGVNQIATTSTGLSADVWIMPFAVFQYLASVVDTAGRPVFVINGDGSNTVGDVSVTGVRGNVAGVPVVVDNGMTGTDSFIVSREALTVLEDGAKYLQDENIINLTRDFSIWGVMALTKNDVKGVARVQHPAA